MPTVGRTTTTGNTIYQDNIGSNNQYALKVTMPESGLIKTLHVYVSGSGATISGQLVLWNSAGAVVGQSGAITFSAGTTGVNHQAWQVADLTTPYQAANAEVLYIGFWRDQTKHALFSYISSGGVIVPSTGSTQANVASPSTLAIGSTMTGQLSAYADYVKGGLGLASGGTFNKYALKRWNSTAGAWQRHPLKRWNATSSQWEWFA